MDKAKDNRDPIQKLKDLHEWMMQNRPSSRIPAKQPVRTTWALQNDKAAAEVADFQNWVKEINGPNFVW